jgi:hypothetical protein
MWSGDEAGHGSSKVTSCYHGYQDGAKPKKKTLPPWHDSCGRQNKKKLCCLAGIIWYMKTFSEIQHKFHVPGHSFLGNDTDFVGH